MNRYAWVLFAVVCLQSGPVFAFGHPSGTEAAPKKADTDPATLPPGLGLGIYCESLKELWSGEISRDFGVKLLDTKPTQGTPADPDQYLWLSEAGNGITDKFAKNPKLLAELIAMKRGEITDEKSVQAIKDKLSAFVDGYRWANCSEKGHFFYAKGQYTCHGDVESAPFQIRSVEWDENRKGIVICDKKGLTARYPQTCLTLELDDIAVGKRYEVDADKAKADVESYSKRHPVQFNAAVKRKKAASACAHYTPPQSGQSVAPKSVAATDQSAPAKPDEASETHESTVVHSSGARGPADVEKE